MTLRTQRGVVRRLIATLVLLLSAVSIADRDTAPTRSVSIAGTEESMTLIVEDARLRDVLEYLAHYQALLVESCVTLEEQVTLEIVALPLAGVLAVLLQDYDVELAPDDPAALPRRLRILPRFACSMSCGVRADVFGARAARNASH